MAREAFVDLGAPHTTTRLSTDDTGALLVNGVAVGTGGGGGGGGGAPSGAAGGDLSGTYPNPTVAAGAITAAKVASDVATTAALTSETTARTAADALLDKALNPTAPKTGAYTAAANEFVVVDATSGAITVTLPTTPANGTRIGVKKSDASTNVVTITAGGSDVFNVTGGSTSITLSLYRQGIQLQYKSGIWYGVAGDLGLSALDARYAAAGTAGGSNVKGMTNGHTVVAMPPRTATVVSSPNTIVAGRYPIVATAAYAGVRFGYGAVGHQESIPDNETWIECALEYNSVRYPMTIGGAQSALLSRKGFLVSDTCQIDIPNGATFYAITRVVAPNNATNLAPNNGYTSLAADVAAGATSITLNHNLLQVGSNPIRVKITGSGAEIVDIYKIVGTGSPPVAPFTASLRTALVSAHVASGSVVGQGMWANRNLYSDQITGGSASTSLSFDILTGTFTTSGVTASTTLTSAANIGDTVIYVANGNNLYGSTMNLDTSTSAESVSVRTITGVASPYTVYLTAALTKAHASGATIAPTIGLDAIPTPTFVTADYVTGTQTPAILQLTDSIGWGQGNYSRTLTSYFNMAMDANHPVLNIGKSGESAQQFANNTNGDQRRKLFEDGKWLFLAYGTNDLYGGRTLAQWQADTVTICTWARARGLKIAMATITPRTTSTDGWVTVTNQSITNPSTNTIRLSANAWIRGGASGYNDLTIEVANAVEVNSSGTLTQDGGYWKADTTTGPYTVDGLHPSSAGHILIAAAITPSLFS